MHALIDYFILQHRTRMNSFTPYPKTGVLIDILKHTIIPVFFCWLALLATPAQAACTGCLCPGDPCQLCPLPAMTDESPKPDEHNLCARIREKVPPTSAPPGSSDYFPSLDQSIAACVSEGGDVIRNRQRGTKFTSRFYCKPPTPLHKLQ